MSGRRTTGRTAAASIAAAVALMLSALPSAATIETSAPTSVSDRNPLPPSGSPGACGTGPLAQDWETDNELVADPDRDGHLTAAWIQDYMDAIAVGYSTNGGRSWKRSLPKTGTCTWALNGDQNPPTTPNDFTKTNSTNDPTLAVGPAADSAAAITYLTSIVSKSDNYGVSAAIVNRSLDGGRTWSDPIVLDTAALTCDAATKICGGGTAVDQTDVVADLDRPGHAHAVWFRLDRDLGTGSVYSSRTTDGGVSWSPPVRVTAMQPGLVSIAGQLSLLPNGDLVVVYLDFALPSLAGVLVLQRATGPTMVMAARSADDGATWSPPTQVALADPVRATLHRVATSADGTVHVAWQRAGADGAFSLMHTESTDGTSWSAARTIGPAIPGSPSEANNRGLAAPALAVAQDGTVAVGYYADRHDGIFGPRGTAYRLRKLDPSGDYLGDQQLAGPFDRTTAPDINGNRADHPFYAGGFIGDYQGIAPIDGGFGLTFVLAQPLEQANFTLSHEPENGNTPTDVYFAWVP